MPPRFNAMRVRAGDRAVSPGVSLVRPGVRGAVSLVLVFNTLATLPRLRH